MAVSLSVATWKASLPIAYRLYLPEAWSNSRQLRQQAKVPAEIPFQTKAVVSPGVRGPGHALGEKHRCCWPMPIGQS